METTNNTYTHIVITHFFKISRLGCVLATAYDRATKERRLFLLFNHWAHIYTRDGAHGLWHELKSDSEYDTIRHRVLEALERKVHPWSANNN